VDVTVDIGLKWTHKIHCNSVEWIVGQERPIEDMTSTRNTPSQLAVWARLDEGDEVSLHGGPKVSCILEEYESPIDTKMV
jgi:hypothetical protein